MIRSPHLRGKPLADLCHRLAISDESGIDVRRTWQREMENSRGPSRAMYASVYRGVAAGATLSDALATTGNFFPRLFLEMVDVGEKSGRLSVVLHRLSRHYQRGHEMARDFRRRLAWPAFELTAALGIVGLMLWVFAALDVKDLNGKPIDLLGLGATGVSAVAVYVQLIVVAALAVSLTLLAVKREMPWTRSLHALALRLPGIGPCLEKLCLARMAWAMHLTLNVEMDLRQLVPLVLRATGNDYYTRCSELVTSRIVAGQPLHAAFTAAGVFPPHFLDTLQVAEESGQLVESMGRLSTQYDEEAEAAMGTLTTFFSFAVWGAIAMVVVVMIFRLFNFYLQTLNDAGGL